MTTYTVTAERAGKYWHLRVPAVDRSTQARKVSEIDEMARDLIAIMTGSEPESFDISVHLVLPADAAEHFQRSTTLRETAAKANAESAVESRAGARALQDAGLSIREIASVMDLSFQRVHQLVNDPDEKPVRRSAGAEAKAPLASRAPKVINVAKVH